MEENNRSRLLKLMKILEDITVHEDNTITTENILNKLANSEGKTYERKAIYKDIDAINKYTNLDIKIDKKKNAYEITTKNNISKEEIEIISNAIITARFMKKKDSRALIDKLYNITGYPKPKDTLIIRDTKDINNAVITDISQNIKLIRQAIKNNNKIKFDYGKYNTKKQFEITKKSCVMSPYADVWFQDNYYLLGNYEENTLSHYRIDRMINIKVLDEKRKSIVDVKANRNGFNINEYMSKLVGMSSGKEAYIEISFNNTNISDVLDVLGDNVKIVESENNTFILKANVVLNKKFTQWIVSFGDGAVVLKPESLKDEVKEIFRKANNNYRRKKI